VLTGRFPVGKDSSEPPSPPQNSCWSLHACRYAISRSLHNAVPKAVVTVTVKALVEAVAASGTDIVYADAMSNSLP
jgi:hypothetical protein